MNTIPTRTAVLSGFKDGDGQRERDGEKGREGEGGRGALHACTYLQDVVHVIPMREQSEIPGGEESVRVRVRVRA